MIAYYIEYNPSTVFPFPYYDFSFFLNAINCQIDLWERGKNIFPQIIIGYKVRRENVLSL